MEDNKVIAVAVIGAAATIVAALIGLAGGHSSDQGDTPGGVALPTAAPTVPPAVPTTSDPVITTDPPTPDPEPTPANEIYHQGRVVVAAGQDLGLGASPDDDQWSGSDLQFTGQSVYPRSVGVKIVEVHKNSDSVCQKASGYGDRSIAPRKSRMFCVQTYPERRYAFIKVVSVVSGDSVTLDVRAYSLPGD